MTMVFKTVCEALADFRLASALADRVVLEEVDWITEDVVDDYRTWHGLDDGHPYFVWTRIAQLAKDAGFRIRGQFNGEPGEPDARAARRALWFLRWHGSPPDAVVLIRDDDRQSSRRQGLEQARNESGMTCPILIGLAHLKRECWVLAGFDPINEAEEKELQKLIAELTFDPRLEPQRLTGKHHELRDAKRVLMSSPAAMSGKQDAGPLPLSLRSRVEAARRG